MNLLEKAANYVEVNGWTTHAISDGEGRVCLMGALFAGLGHLCTEWNPSREELTEFADAVAALRAECVRRYPQVPGANNTRVHIIPNVNDNYVQDQFEAIDILKHAAKQLNETES